ncbi:MAG: DUF1553 domain-containing protein [Planctomycetes bacterium]|nr:DUF1553 domain-containing protein [Planctomycetota bacterium]
MCFRRLWLVAFLMACAIGPHPLLAAPKDDPKGIEFFENRIRPVLVEQCYTCHSAAAEANKKLRGSLFLDSKDGLLKGGDTGPAIVPGKPKESLIIQSLHQSGDVKMPPKGKLPANIIADFETWIAMGAPDPRVTATVKRKGLSLEEGRQFWAYQPVRAPAIPENAKNDEIAAFISAALKAKGLALAHEADRATLARRLYFDLIGMPPTPEEIDAFVSDRSADAYEKLVDRLLASPHFGERWGRHWLDVARFAESMTLRGFVFKESWRYRDYVIESFNKDVPFDQFIREQIAGDLLPSDSTEKRRRQLTATTYLALGNNNLEEQDKKQLEMDVVDEQLDAISRGFLGQTITCARCHDHKFDPIPTKDYYALAGILKNTRTLAHSNVSMWLEMPLPGDPVGEKLAKEHDAAVAALKKDIQSLKDVVAKFAKPLDPKKPHVHAVKDLPGIVVDDAQAKKVGTWKPSQYSGSYVGAGYIHDDGMDKGEKSLTFHPEITKTGKYEVRIAYSPASNRSPNVPVTIFCAEGEKTVHVDQKKAPEIDGLFHSLGQYTFEKNGQNFVIIANHDTTGVVIADAVLFIPVEMLVNIKTEKPASKEPAPPEVAKLKALEDQLKKLQANTPKRERVMSIEEEAKIVDLKVHIRGSVHSLGEPAPRGFLQVAMTGSMPKLPANESGRRQLAEWIAHRDNPLTARVFANRAWHWLIGVGLVRTTDNFGTTGEKPSHPELLDFLADRFVEDGWSVKKLVRRMVLSRVYRQSVDGDAKALSVDPENRLLAHMNRRRLEAECIRDSILLVSGQLKLDAGGPTFNMALGADYGFKHTDLRRSVYSPVFRNSLPELFEAFDFADPSVSTGRRNVSTVAPQALFLMNNPFVQQQSVLAAKKLLEEKGLSDAERITKAFRQTLGRKPSDAEKRLAEMYIGEASQDPKLQQEQWAQFVQTLFASVDFRYVK